jgi:hypothetical protein
MRIAAAKKSPQATKKLQKSLRGRSRNQTKQFKPLKTHKKIELKRQHENKIVVKKQETRS